MPMAVSRLPTRSDAEWDQIKERLDQAKFGGGTFKQFATLLLSDEDRDQQLFRNAAGVIEGELDPEVLVYPASLPIP